MLKVLEVLNDASEIGIAREVFELDNESVFFHSGTDTEKLICLLLFPSKTFISFAHEENVEIIINNKNDTFTPRKNFFPITQSFSLRERREKKENIWFV